MNSIKTFAVLTFCCCFAITTQAQQEERSIKPLPAEALKPASADKPSAEITAKQINTDAKPAVPKLPAAEENKEEMKAMEIKPGRQGKEVKNIDRPRPSTVEPAKKVEPAAKPKPVVAVIPEG